MLLAINRMLTERERQSHHATSTAFATAWFCNSLGVVLFETRNHSRLDPTVLDLLLALARISVLLNQKQPGSAPRLIRPYVESICESISQLAGRVTGGASRSPYPSLDFNLSSSFRVHDQLLEHALNIDSQ
ncbi:hypothetical protein CA85_40620 [Allorhodopirellula solitaria]|uniref:Uncharacterized protein n=1 Tax=Allorhodopirellula solitaria TaxID=2527987 RepID=A0A5C5X1P7_9BACT|nr:hypothetical protein CA85_40620 [Allorhodopirellula solitaria]